MEWRLIQLHIPNTDLSLRFSHTRRHMVPSKTLFNLPRGERVCDQTTIRKSLYLLAHYRLMHLSFQKISILFIRVAVATAASVLDAPHIRIMTQAENTSGQPGHP